MICRSPQHYSINNFIYAQVSYKDNAKELFPRIIAKKQVNSDNVYYDITPYYIVIKVITTVTLLKTYKTVYVLSLKNNYIIVI